MRRSLGALLLFATVGHAQENTCSLSGTVLSRSVATGVMIDGAQVSIPRLNKTTTTDSIGAFRLSGLACGRQEVQVRKIGFTVARDTVDLAPAEELRRTYTMISVAQLDTVRTTSDEIQYQTPRLQDFEARRKGRNVGGYFIGEADLRKLDHVSTSSLTRSRVPGLQFITYRGITAARGRVNLGERPSNMITGDPKSPTGCWVAVFLDGILIFDGAPKTGSPPPDIDQFMARSLSGIEYYSNAGSLPFQFKTTLTTCGTLLLWTRGR